MSKSSGSSPSVSIVEISRDAIPRDGKRRGSSPNVTRRGRRNVEKEQNDVLDEEEISPLNNPADEARALGQDVRISHFFSGISCAFLILYFVLLNIIVFVVSF